MATHPGAIREHRSSEPRTERPPGAVTEAPFGRASAASARENPLAPRTERSSDIVPAFSRALAWGDAPGAFPRGRALVELAEPFITASQTGVRRPAPVPWPVFHADGRSVSPALARFLELDPAWLGLSIGPEGRLAPGIALPAVVERCLDPELAVWVEGLEPILPGAFYVLPTSAHDRCDLLYVAADSVDEVVFTLEVAHDGTLDLRVSYPAIDVYLAHTFGAIDFDAEFHPADEEALAPVRRRFFDGRSSLFAFES